MNLISSRPRLNTKSKSKASLRAFRFSPRKVSCWLHMPGSAKGMRLTKKNASSHSQLKPTFAHSWRQFRRDRPRVSKKIFSSWRNLVGILRLLSIKTRWSKQVLKLSVIWNKSSRRWPRKLKQAGPAYRWSTVILVTLTCTIREKSGYHFTQSARLWPSR